MAVSGVEATEVTDGEVLVLLYIESRLQQEVMDCPDFCNCFLRFKQREKVSGNRWKTMERRQLSASSTLNRWLNRNGLTEWGCCDYYDQFRKTYVAGGNWNVYI